MSWLQLDLLPKPTLSNKTNPFTPTFLTPISTLFFLIVHDTPPSCSIHEAMRDQMEGFVALTFSVGCASHSSVAVIQNPTRNPPREPNPLPASGGGESSSSAKMRNSLGLPPLPRANLSAGLQRLIKSFKNLSQLFALYKEEDEEVDMVIGFPTDVQHVTHIGLDGSNTTVAPMKVMDGAPELLSLHSFSLDQFELAMAAARLDAPLPSDPLRLG